MKTYIYPAVFHEGRNAITVYFPDLACISQGKNYHQAFKRAREVLSLHLSGMIEDGETIPAPSSLKSIPLNAGEALALIEIKL